MRSLCDRYNVVHFVDELKTGFRVARGGLQETLDKVATAVDITMNQSPQGDDVIRSIIKAKPLAWKNNPGVSIKSDSYS